MVPDRKLWTDCGFLRPDGQPLPLPAVLFGRGAVAVLSMLAISGMGPVLAQDSTRSPGSEAIGNTLRGIAALDERNAWVVGDRGTILRTSDGGATWTEAGTISTSARAGENLDPATRRLLIQVREQAGTSAEPVRQSVRRSLACRLRAISFADSRLGWIAGGSVLPGEGNVDGMLFATTDGGSTWNRVSVPGLPLLVRCERESPLSGWGVGLPGHLSPGGEYETGDGGRNWSSRIAAHRNQAFVDADRVGGTTVAVAPDGSLWRLESARCEPAVILDRTAGPLRRVRMLDAQRGWAVGDGGTLLETADGGQSWQRCEVRGPAAGMTGSFDLLTLDVSPQAVRFAGSPGTVVFQLDPATRQLDAIPTGSASSLHDMRFTGTSAGWAVGQGGTILATSSSGREWHTQRGGIPQVAILAIAIGSAEAPWELLARHGLEDALACALVHVARNGGQSAEFARVDEAAERASCVEMHLVRPWQIHSADRIDLDRMRRRLAILIRQTRPLVVVSSQTELRGPDGGVLDGHALLDEIIALAASEARLPAAEAGGLAAWQVVRLATPDLVGSGDWAMESSLWMATRGRSVADAALICRAITGLPWVGPARQAWRVSQCDRSRRSPASEGLMAGLAVGSDRHFRSSNPSSASATLASLNRSMQKASELEQLASAQAITSQDLVVWRSQAGMWSAQADQELAGIWLAQLAIACLERGRLNLAVEAAGLLVFGCPGHPLGPEVAVWLTRAGTSSEAHVARTGPAPVWRPAGVSALRLPSLGGAASPISAMVAVPKFEAQPLVWNPDAAGPADDPAEAGDIAEALNEVLELGGPGAVGNLRPDWMTVAGQVRELLARYPTLAQNPDILLAQANALREASGWAAAEGLFASLADRRSGFDPCFQQLAEREAAISGDRNGRIAVEIRPLPVATTRPLLDGRLDEELWTSLLAGDQLYSFSPRDPTGNLRSEQDRVWIASDQQYLYLAGRITRFRARQPARQPASARVRDGLRPDRDQVCIRMDLDRDGAWPFWLAVDERGDVAEGVGNTIDWNPQWFVAVADEGEAAWRFEAAIAWNQFGLPGPPGTGKPIAMSLTREAADAGRSLWGQGLPAFRTRTASLSVPRLDPSGSFLIGASANSPDGPR